MPSPASPLQTIAAAARRHLRPLSQGHLPPAGPLRHPAPAGYTDSFEDVARARDLSVIADPDLHHSLYGHQQGRAVLQDIEAARITRVVLISPSHLKECGIGEYGRYLAGELAGQGLAVDVLRSSAAALALGEALRGALVVVNHGPGLYDGLNPRLSQGESTTALLQRLDRMRREFGALPLVLHHSLIDTNQPLLFSRQQQILRAGIPSFSFVAAAGRHFFLPTLELGVSPVPVPDHSYSPDRRPAPRGGGVLRVFPIRGQGL